MPHLSPMSWTLFLLLIWTMTMTWASLNFHINTPSFPTVNPPKPASMTSSWIWS